MAAPFAGAQEVTPDVRRSQAAARIGVGILQRELGLREAVELALKNNLDIEIERASRAIAYQGIQSARGAFDPTFRWAPSIDSRATPTGSVLQAADGRLVDRFMGQNFYFRQPLPWQGSSVNLDFENGRTSTNNPFVALNPFVTSRLAIGFTQPLLRNRLIDQLRADITVRKKQADISEIEFEVKVIDVVTRVEQAYWDLVAARQDVQVKADAVDWAREQVARSKRMIETGTLAPVEIAAAEAELERRLDTYFTSLGLVTEAENSLKIMLASDRDSTLWGDEIVPAESRRLEAPAVENLREAVDDAIRVRPELKLVGLRLENNDVQKELAKNQTKPQVNLFAGYTSMGLGGAASTAGNPFEDMNAGLFRQVNELSARAGLPPLPMPTFAGLPSNLVGGYGTALSNMFGGNFQGVQAGISFDLNLRNRTAEANLAQATIAERRLQLERMRVEQGVEAQVRNALQSLETARQRMTAAEASARAAKEKLDSETRLFQTGESTNFMVLTRQNEYSDSRHRAVVASLDYNRSVARLLQALGRTLRFHQIELQ